MLLRTFPASQFQESSRMSPCEGQHPRIPDPNLKFLSDNGFIYVSNFNYSSSRRSPVIRKPDGRYCLFTDDHHCEANSQINIWKTSRDQELVYHSVDRVLLGAERHHSGTVLWLWLLSLSFSSLRKYAPIPFHTSPKQPGFAAVWAPLSQQHSMLAGSQQRVAIAVAHNRITEPVSARLSNFNRTKTTDEYLHSHERRQNGFWERAFTLITADKQQGFPVADSVSNVECAYGHDEMRWQ
ncbi:hypothetical protein F2P81_007199 [Scophthalmus maximus]|uniref:Uncharacterized protein n=1 Tax=Scophthalmus maximus TaxID=52904 RepID=A0A6A4TEN3_SCOMX|nr:hypothetical protein F2P81_007199 [Scophthalmus maximus]